MTKQHDYNDGRPFPYLTPHKMLQQVKIPYSGVEKSCQWYNTMRSAVLEYGVLLIDIHEFEYDKSLCP
jgi:hypothetical protein